MDVKIEFGKNVKLYREAIGMSQQELSDILDINYSNVSRIETGKQFVSPATLEKLCKVLGVSCASLFDFKKSEKSDEMTELIKYVQELDNNGVRFFTSSVKAYLKEKNK